MLIAPRPPRVVRPDEIDLVISYRGPASYRASASIDPVTWTRTFGSQAERRAVGTRTVRLMKLDDGCGCVDYTSPSDTRYVAGTDSATDSASDSARRAFSPASLRRSASVQLRSSSSANRAG